MKLKIEIDLDELSRRYSNITPEIELILAKMTDTIYYHEAEGKRRLVDSGGKVVGFAEVLKGGI